MRVWRERSFIHSDQRKINATCKQVLYTACRVLFVGKRSGRSQSISEEAASEGFSGSEVQPRSSKAKASGKDSPYVSRSPFKYYHVYRIVTILQWAGLLLSQSIAQPPLHAVWAWDSSIKKIPVPSQSVCRTDFPNLPFRLFTYAYRFLLFKFKKLFLIHSHVLVLMHRQIWSDLLSSVSLHYSFNMFLFLREQTTKYLKGERDTVSERCSRSCSLWRLTSKMAASSWRCRLALSLAFSSRRVCIQSLTTRLETGI